MGVALMCLSIRQSNKLCVRQSPRQQNVPFFRASLQETLFQWYSIPTRLRLVSNNGHCSSTPALSKDAMDSTYLIPVNNNHCLWFCHLVLVMTIPTLVNTTLSALLLYILTTCHPISTLFDCCQGLQAIQYF